MVPLFIAPSLANAAADRARLWTANLADWDALLLRGEAPFLSSAFEPLRDLSVLRLTLQGSAAPTYESRGRNPAQIRSDQAALEVWHAPNRAWAFGLGANALAWSEDHSDAQDWSAQVKDNRVSVPLSLAYWHSSRHPWEYGALVRLLDGERGSWRAAFLATRNGSESRGVRKGHRAWGVQRDLQERDLEIEIGFGRELHLEHWSISALERQVTEAGADSTRHDWKANYRVAQWSADMSTRVGLELGVVEAKAFYSWARPDFDSLAYRLSDSSQAFGVGMGFRPAWGQGKGSEKWKGNEGWHLRSDYTESQVFTEGTRRPAGSEDSKRFHHALGRAITTQSGVEWSSSCSRDSLRGLRYQVGAFYRYYRYLTQPHPDAYYARKETLSYNRLESSLLASLYGGFLQSAELLSAEFRSQSGEFRPSVSALLGNWAVSASLPTAFIHLSGSVHGETVTRKLLAVEVERQYNQSLRGALVTAAPSLGLGYHFGPLSVNVRASHALILWSDLRGGSEPGGATEGDHPWHGNGALLEASTVLNF
jgi:hypothetical protein